MANMTPIVHKNIAEKKKDLNKVIEAINVKSKKNIINWGNDPETMEKLTIKYIPFPSLRLNEMCSGIPKGKVSIVAGMPDSGKTSLILESIGMAMKEDPDFVAVWLESEKSLELTSLRDMHGIDLSRFIYLELGKDEPAEKTLDILENIINVGGIDIAVINSLKCLTPKKEMSDSMDDQNIGLQARLNSKFMRKIVPTIAEQETALCMTQHLSTQIGTMYGDPMTISGGYAIRFASMLTLDLRKKVIQKDDPIAEKEGLKIGVHVVKNHCNQTKYPYVRGDYFVKFGEGTQIFTEVIELAIEGGILYRGGSWISEIDPNTGEAKVLEDGTVLKWQGMAKTKTYVETNPDYYKYLKEAVLNQGITVETMDEEEVVAAQELEKLTDEQAAEINNLLDGVEEETANKEDKKKPSKTKKAKK